MSEPVAESAVCKLGTVSSREKLRCPVASSFPYQQGQQSEAIFSSADCGILDASLLSEIYFYMPGDDFRGENAFKVLQIFLFSFLEWFTDRYHELSYK